MSSVVMLCSKCGITLPTESEGGDRPRSADTVGAMSICNTSLSFGQLKKKCIIDFKLIQSNTMQRLNLTLVLQTLVTFCRHFQLKQWVP